MVHFLVQFAFQNEFRFGSHYIMVFEKLRKFNRINQSIGVVI